VKRDIAIAQHALSLWKSSCNKNIEGERCILSEKSGGKSIRELEAIPKMGRYFFPWGGFRLDTLNPLCDMNVIVVVSDTLRRDHVGC
jgi:hypothetical protein